MRLELENRVSRIQPGLTELIVSRRCFAIWKALALAIGIRSWLKAAVPAPGNATKNARVRSRPIAAIRATAEPTVVSGYTMAC